MKLISSALIFEELQELKSEILELKQLLKAEKTEKIETIETAKNTYYPRSNQSKQSLKYRIAHILKELKIPAHYHGYTYLCEGIKLVYQDEKYYTITKFLYPELAKTFETTWGRVERAIRYAIEVSWNKNKSHPIYRYYEERPTNAQFIAEVVELLKWDDQSNA